MPLYQTWEEFTRAAEKLYLSDPMKVLGRGGDLKHGGSVEEKSAGIRSKIEQKEEGLLGVRVSGLAWVRGWRYLLSF